MSCRGIFNVRAVRTMCAADFARRADQVIVFRRDASLAGLEAIEIACDAIL